MPTTPRANTICAERDRILIVEKSEDRAMVPSARMIIKTDGYDVVDLG